MAVPVFSRRTVAAHIMWTCLECGCHSVNIDFKSDDDRLDAAKRTADLWNCGKVISMSPGE